MVEYYTDFANFEQGTTGAQLRILSFWLKSCFIFSHHLLVLFLTYMNNDTINFPYFLVKYFHILNCSFIAQYVANQLTERFVGEAWHQLILADVRNKGLSVWVSMTNDDNE